MKNNKMKRTSDEEYLKMTQNCKDFIQQRGYITKPLSLEESEFPLAFNILLHRDAELFERLLRAIYHPQNSYCVHVDANSPEGFQRVIKSITACFPNVFLATKLERIVYAGYSRLQADINCMMDHLASGIEWKYLFNLAGQAFPLMSNAELVQILKIYNGVNDIEGIYGRRVHRSRFENEYIEVDHKTLKKTGNKNPRPPHDIDIVRGSAYGVFSQAFVNYIVTDPWAVDLRKWSERTYSPDEHYWATLHHTYTNPHLNVPGSYSGQYFPPLDSITLHYNFYNNICITHT
jgi:beta-1,3-galactosyl-O-glycosyl-glycoprotein beta-1,6-N-acetylglucosaminyltransferase/N-acetyllactosaminide beta-1,6-N-acetylglucosaminyltransferase/mucin type N-acetylglucosaminyltransferase 3